MATKTGPSSLDRLEAVGRKLETAESLVSNLRAERDATLLQAREENPHLTLQYLADKVGMRREAAHYALLRARANRRENA